MTHSPRFSLSRAWLSRLIRLCILKFRAHARPSPEPTMNRILFCLLSSVLILSLCACSGVPTTTLPPPPPSNATLSLTLRAAPPSPSAPGSIKARSA